jgi:hypothetical protein
MPAWNLKVSFGIFAQSKNCAVTITRQQPINNKEMVFSVQFMSMAAHTTMEYIIPSLSNNCMATEERCFLRGPWRYVISKTSWLAPHQQTCI